MILCITYFIFRFTVHQGQWYGDVAVKILDMENMDDEATLEAFRLDVATFRKTRHENVILFMGACMNPPKLAIVTSLCKGSNRNNPTILNINSIYDAANLSKIYCYQPMGSFISHVDSFLDIFDPSLLRGPLYNIRLKPLPWPFVHGL